MRDEGPKATEAPAVPEGFAPERPDGLSLALNALPFALLALGATLSVALADGGAAVALFLA